MSTIESEKLWPDGERLAQLRDVRRDIEPDRPFQDWLQAYARIIAPRADGVIVECGCALLITYCLFEGTWLQCPRYRYRSGSLLFGYFHDGNMSKCDIETEPLPLDTRVRRSIFNGIIRHLRINQPYFHKFEAIFSKRHSASVTPNPRSLKGLFQFYPQKQPYSNSGKFMMNIKTGTPGSIWGVREYATADIQPRFQRADTFVQPTL